MTPRIATENLDLKCPVPDTFHCQPELCFQTPEANIRTTQESYFQLQIFHFRRAVFWQNSEVGVASGARIEKNIRISCSYSPSRGVPARQIVQRPTAQRPPSSRPIARAQRPPDRPSACGVCKLHRKYLAGEPWGVPGKSGGGAAVASALLSKLRANDMLMMGEVVAFCSTW